MSYYGVRRDANSGMFATRFFFKVIKEYFEKVLRLTSEMIFEPAFSVTDVEKEKKIIYEEINRSNDRSFNKLMIEIDKVMYPNSYINNKTLGEKETIEKFDAEMIRAFKEKFYKPENMVISVSGDITFKKAEKLIDKYFASLFVCENESKIIKENIEPNIKEKYVIVDKAMERSIVAIRIKTPKLADDNFPATKFYNFILGRGQNSRLFNRLREKKGYVYSTGSSLLANHRFGFLTIDAQVHSSKIKDVLKEIKNVLSDLARKKISEKELYRIKNQFKSNLLFLKEASTFQKCLDNVNELSMEGFIRNEEYWLNEINSVTAEQIEEIAKQIYNEKDFVVGAIGKDINIKDLKAFK
ncbi:MAG: pitrilysin family protein [Clostridia bacterium]|nr:pitrilysin family protein [Clostridia bacterium]